MSAQDPASAPMAVPPHRLLFLHGLFRKSYPHSGRTVAELLAKGLDRAGVAAAPDLLLDDGGRCPRYLVQPESETADWHAIEVVEVVYDDIIKARDGRRPLMHRALIGLWTLVTEGPRMLRLLCPGYPRIRARQALMASVLAVVFFAAVALTIAVLIPIVHGAYGYLMVVLKWVDILPKEFDAFLTRGVEAAESTHLAGSIAFLALAAVAGRLFIRKGFSETCEDAVSAIFAVIDFQKPGSALRCAILERVGSALRAGPGSDKHRSLSVLAFSQGSLLAIDALFPTQSVAGRGAAVRPRIDLLVTLGCPLAIVTRLWPSRPSRAQPDQAEVRHWINYYETHDQLGGSIASLVKAENVMIEVDDREFSYADPAGRPWALPHFAYWLEGPENERPSATRIATELVHASS